MFSHLTCTCGVALCVFVCRRYRTPSVLASLPHLPPPPLHPPLIMLTHSPSELTPLALHPLLSFHVACFLQIGACTFARPTLYFGRALFTPLLVFYESDHAPICCAPTGRSHYLTLRSLNRHLRLVSRRHDVTASRRLHNLI